MDKLLKSLSILFLAASIGSANTKRSVIDPPQKVVKRTKNYTVILKLIPYQPIFGPSETFWGGWDGKQKIIGNIEAKYHGTAIAVPRSSYCDIANVNSVRLTEKKGGARLEIEGGDASTAYHCLLTFKLDSLIARKICDGEFPDHFFEQTTYVNRAVPDE